MSDHFVRIYNGPENESNIIGFSRSAACTVTDPLLFNFFEEKGYECTRVFETPHGSFSFSHLEIKPPLSSEHITEFGKICCSGGIINDRKVDPLVYADNNFVYVFDHTVTIPGFPNDLARFVTRN